jgi:hypothetical protein
MNNYTVSVTPQPTIYYQGNKLLLFIFLIFVIIWSIFVIFIFPRLQKFYKRLSRKIPLDE